jgi:hypothetical protein
VTGYCEHPDEEGAELTDAELCEVELCEVEGELCEVEGEQIWLCRRHRP